MEHLEDRRLLTTVAPGFAAVEYFDYTAPSVNGPVELAVGQGGGFGNDLFVVDNLSRQLYQLQDSNADGDALDAGESTLVFQFPTGGATRPQNLLFGNGVGAFDNDLFMIDDGPNQVFRVSDDTGPYVISNFAPTSGATLITPTGADFTPSGSEMLVADAGSFWVRDGKVMKITQAGAVSVWTDGGNLPGGRMWDNNAAAETTSDGWFTVINQGIGGGSQKELVQFRDNNSDGDALDAGEARVLVDRAIGVVGAFTFDDNDVLYMNGGVTGTGVSRFEDLNGDGDFYDTAASAFDPGERTLIVDNIPGGLRSIAIGPSDELFVGYSTGTRGKILRITDNHPTADAGGPYLAIEGDALQLDGSGSSDPNQSTASLTFTWDLDGDGLFGETGVAALLGDEVGVSPILSAASLDGPTSVQVDLRVTDSDGNTSDDAATVDVDNADPTADAGGPYTITEFDPLVLNGSGSDPAGASDPLTFEWDFDYDGVAFDVDATGAGPTWVAPNGPATAVVAVRTQDDDSGVSSIDTATITVTAVAPLAPTTPDLDSASDSGASSSDDLTNITSPLLTGSTVHPNISIELFDGAASLGTTIANAVGVWSINVGPLSNGTHAVTAEAIDADGDHSAASGILNLTIDTVAPTVTVEQAVGQADPTAASPINFTASYSETVTGFADEDVVLLGSAGAATAVVSGAGALYDIAVSGMTGAGVVIASVPVGVAADTAGNLSEASTSVDNSVLFTTNDAPEITSLSADAGSGSPAAPGQTVTVAALFNDPNPNDTHTASIDWGDGAVTAGVVDQPNDSVVGTHSYTNGGVYTVIVTVADNGGLDDTDATVVLVTGVRLTPDGVLQIVGTAGKDDIRVLDRGSQIRVDANLGGGARRSLRFDENDVLSIEIHAGSGNDHVTIGNRVSA
ncbi:MAG: PKD domain-containing protein, partial [Pirellulaceae bacterium]|nr:PKD domain-containing protein [Pirellulaceae bacterium]